METIQMTNYEKCCEQWRKKFQQMNQDYLMRLLPEITAEGNHLILYHFGRKLAVHRETGEITAPADQEPVSCWEKINVYTLFGYISPTAHLQNEWVPFDKLKRTAPFYQAFRKSIIEPFARTFTGHIQELERACTALGGEKLPYSDAGYEIKAFSCIPLRFLYWEGDEEFPSQGNILFDASATDFIHEESIVSIAAVGFYRLAKEAGVPLDRSAFPIC